MIEKPCNGLTGAELAERAQRADKMLTEREQKAAAVLGLKNALGAFNDALGQVAGLGLSVTVALQTVGMKQPAVQVAISEKIEY